MELNLLKRRKGETNEKSVIKCNPTDPLQFMSFNKTQPVIRTFPIVEFEQLNPKQQQTAKLVTNALDERRQELIISHGSAGTGKSFIIHYLRDYCQRKKIRFRVLAFTGSSAFASGGITIHSALSLGLAYRRHPPEKYVEFPRERLKGLRLLIFEEAYMCGVAMLEYVSRRLCAIFQNQEPWGGLTVLAMGDLAQLTPVADRPLFYNSPNAEGFTADGIKCYQQFKKCVILTQIMRQDESETEFKRILSCIRVGQLLPEDIQTLESRSLDNLSLTLDAEELSLFLSAPVIFSDNESANDYNEKRINDMEVEITNVNSIDMRDETVSGDVLKLCVGARCMLTKNIFVAAGLYNGAMVVITEISSTVDKHGMPNFVFIRPDAYFGFAFPLRNDIPITPVTLPFTEKFTGVTYTKKFYPLQLGWGITCHRAQGKTCSRVVIGNPVPGDLSTMFTTQSPQLLYVAMSRATRLSGVMFQQPFAENLVIGNRRQALDQWQRELERLETLAANTSI